LEGPAFILRALGSPSNGTASCGVYPVGDKRDIFIAPKGGQAPLLEALSTFRTALQKETKQEELSFKQ
jgi:hypothetical protein